MEMKKKLDGGELNESMKAQKSALSDDELAAVAGGTDAVGGDDGDCGEYQTLEESKYFFSPKLKRELDLGAILRPESDGSEGSSYSKDEFIDSIINSLKKK